jgi:hypothetical protein
VNETAIKIIGGVILAVLGWALSAIIQELKDTENAMAVVEHRLSVLETKFNDHLVLVHKE